MRTIQERIFQLPAMLRRDRLLARLGSRANVEPRESQTVTLEFYDSFDRDLWFAGRALYRAGQEWVVTALDDLLIAEPIARCPAENRVPRFAWDLPDTPLRQAVAEPLKLRALLPLVPVTACTEWVQVCNDDQKTVLRLKLQSISTPRDQQPAMLELCSIQPLRGYEAEASRVVDLLRELGLYPADSWAAARVVAELAAIPDVPPGPPVAALDPAQSSRGAVCGLVRDLWAAALSRETGIVDDIDTEFLHEYRVALRRIRSLIALSDGVFPQDHTRELKDGFKRLAGTTNRLRDLDVYLLSREPYRELLPAGLRAGLDEMFADFASQREREQLAVRSLLVSAEYRRQGEELQRLLTAAERAPAGQTARQPVVQLAGQIIGRRYKKVLPQAKTVDEATPDATVHQLRIECKKLRYALEFFGALCEPAVLAAGLKRLKRLQDTLGAFNDLAVQQAALAGYLTEKQASRHPSVTLAAAVGGLLGVLHQRQVQERTRVAAEIHRFCAADVAAAFSRMCQTVKRAA